MKTDRLLGILTTLLQKGKVTAPELARRFEVSRRTILRDVEELCMAGIPVITAQGGDGGISIAEGFNLERGLLSREELNSVLTGLKSLESVSDTSHIKELINKRSPGEAAESQSDRIIIDLASHYKDSLSEKIELFNKAILDKRKVSFEYYSPDGHKTRTVEPYLITFRWSSWYVLCFCCTANDFRLFKLNRLWDAKLSDQYFTPRKIPNEKCDPGNAFKDKAEVTLLFDQSAEYLLVEAYGPHSYEKLANGRLKSTIGYTNRDFILSWILGFGDKVIVLAPQEMIDAHKEIAKNLLQKYEHDK